VFYLAVATTGGEYVWSTIRNVLIRVPRRTDYLLARTGFLVLIGSIIVVGLAIIGAGLPIIFGSSAPLTLTRRPDTLTMVAAVACAEIAVFLYVSLGIFLATLLRDRATPLVVGMLVLVLQSILSPLSIWSQNDALVWVPRIFPSNAVGTLFLAVEREAGFIATDTVLPPFLSGPWQVAATIAIGWIIGLAMASAAVLARSDITE
jgi:hypothetical protein